MDYCLLPPTPAFLNLTLTYILLTSTMIEAVFETQANFRMPEVEGQAFSPLCSYRSMAVG